MPDIVKHRCPHLGLEDDPATWFAFPAEENHCHLRRSPRAVETSYQQEYCLSDNYTACPLLASQKPVVAPIPTPEGTDEEEPEPARPRRRLAPWLWGVLILAVIAGALYVLGSLLWGQRAPAAPPPTTTPPEAILQPSQTPTATLEPTTTPTATLPPTATTEPTVEATSVSSMEPSPGATEPMRLTLAFDSYVRTGPGRDFATVAYLSAGTPLIILGRDLDGFWLWVRLDSGKEGWVAVTQFPPETVDIKAIPVATEIPTLSVTATSGG